MKNLRIGLFVVGLLSLAYVMAPSDVLAQEEKLPPCCFNRPADLAPAPAAAIALSIDLNARPFAELSSAATPAAYAAYRGKMVAVIESRRSAYRRLS